MKARTIFSGLLIATAVSGALAAQQRGTDDEWCRDENWGRDRVGVCEVREFTVAATAGVLTVQGANGGISVEGQARSDVRILAKVVATADTQARARELANDIRISPTPEHVEADGPRGLQRHEGWSVSYRVSSPRAVNLALKTSNGGITVRDMDSKVEFRTTNGGVKLVNMSGDVRGVTTNGGVDVDLDGPSWNGEGLDVETSNGGVKVAIPENYSARLEVRTDNGGMNIDYPGAVQSRPGREVSVQLGSGGAPIRVRTSNGGVRVTRK